MGSIEATLSSETNKVKTRKRSFSEPSSNLTLTLVQFYDCEKPMQEIDVDEGVGKDAARPRRRRSGGSGFGGMDWHETVRCSVLIDDRG